MSEHRCASGNGVLGIVLYATVILVTTGCRQQDVRARENFVLEKQVAKLLDSSVVETNQVALVKTQREIIDLCRNTPEGFEVVTDVMEARVSENPDDLQTAKLLKGIYLRELHDPDKAAQLYEGLVSHDPDNVPLKQELVQLYQAAERYGDVADLYQNEIGTGRGNDEWLEFQVASHLIYAGKTEEGLEYACQHQDDEPSAENLERMSRLYETANQWRKAAEELNKAIQTASNQQHSANMSIHLGELYIRSQQYEEALTHLSRLKNSPALNQQQKSVVNEQIFRVYKKQGRLSELNIEAGK